MDDDEITDVYYVVQRQAGVTRLGAPRWEDHRFFTVRHMAQLLLERVEQSAPGQWRLIERTDRVL